MLRCLRPAKSRNNSTIMHVSFLLRLVCRSAAASCSVGSRSQCDRSGSNGQERERAEGEEGQEGEEDPEDIGSRTTSGFRSSFRSSFFARPGEGGDSGQHPHREATGSMFFCSCFLLSMLFMVFVIQGRAVGRAGQLVRLRGRRRHQGLA